MANDQNIALALIKELRFEEVQEVLARMEDSDKANQLDYLSSLIEVNAVQNVGYLKDHPFHITRLTTVRNSLFYLIEGYEKLFLENDRASAFESFSHGISASPINGEVEIQKALLIGMFKVINSGMTVSNEGFEKYLIQFQNLISDVYDRFWFHYFRIELFDLTTDYHENRHEKSQFYEMELNSLNNLKPHLNNNRIMALIQNINGNFHVKYDGSKALEFYYSSQQLMDSSAYFDRSRFRIALDIARANAKNGKLDKAISELHEAKKIISVGNGLVNQLNYNFFLSEFHQNLKRYDSANYYLKEVFRLDKKLNNRETNKEISRLEVALDTEKKEKQILIEKQKFEEQSQKTKANRNWLIVTCIALLLGASVAILFQKNTTKKRQLAEQQAQLKQQRVDNLLKEQELVSIDAMIEGQEKERQKVAGELHDDLGSLMATIKLHFDNAKVGTQDPALNNAQRLLEEAYQKIRGMAHSKNSGVMSDQGLLPAIKKMAKSISESNTLQVTVEDFGLGERMENSLELSIFRMVQELVANAIKHAEATKVIIQLTQHTDNLNIIVEDDGKGFDRFKLDNKNSGMGLTNIEKRVEHLEGNFTVDSLLGKGTSILIDIPV